MSSPKIRSLVTRDPSLLFVQFENGLWRRYDVARLADKPAFMPLKDPALFRLAQVDAGGYGIVWNDEIDLSEHEIWLRGDAIDAPDEDRGPLEAAEPQR